MKYSSIRSEAGWWRRSNWHGKNIPINEEKHKLAHTINRSLDRESNPRPLAYGKHMATPPALSEQRRQPLSQIPFHKIEGSMTRIVRSAAQYPARNPLENHTTSILDPIALHEWPTEPFRMRVWSNTSCLHNVQWNKRRETQIGSHNK
jgi:hypothetical protein